MTSIQTIYINYPIIKLKLSNNKARTCQKHAENIPETDQNRVAVIFTGYLYIS